MCEAITIGCILYLTLTLTIVLGDRVFSVEWNHRQDVAVKGRVRFRFSAHSDFDVGYLRNDAMYAFGEYSYWEFVGKLYKN